MRLKLEKEEPSFSHRHLIGKTFSYLPEEFPFAKLFLERFNFLQSKKGKKAVTDLAEVHTGEDSTTLEDIIKALYSFEEESAFQEVYQAFLKKVCVPLFDTPFRFQFKPGIRFHLPGTMTVLFHTDEWYGHGKNVYNFWLPLTDAADSNSLWCANFEDSLKETKRIEVEQPDLHEINSRLSRLTKPINAHVGDVYVFHSKSVHGTRVNTTEKTRISLDFRVLLEDEDAGTKNSASYFIGFDKQKPTLALPSIKQRGIAYYDKQHGISRFIQTDCQRLIVQEFARQNNISLVGEEMEIQTLRHHPALQAMSSGLATQQMNAVVLFSVCSLSDSKTDRDRVFEAAKKTGVTLYFANEALQFPTKHTEKDVERAREQMVKAVSP